MPDAPNLQQDLVEELHLLTAAARAAGAIAMRHFETDLSHWKKGDDSPVSEADMEIDRMLHNSLMAARPDYGWLSEETEDDEARLEKTRCFVVDPIDGTRAFLQGKPHFVISLAIVEAGRPIVGALFAPAEDRLFTAIRGGGSFVNQQPITPSATAQLNGAHMIGGEMMYKHPAWPTPWPDPQISTVNSIAYSIALVAAGLADGAIALNTKADWDLAAADLLIHEAGGQLTDYEGTPFTYNKRDPRHFTLIAANKGFHPVLMEKLTEFAQALASQ